MKRNLLDSENYSGGDYKAPCEPLDKCCIFIPIETGIKIFGVLYILGFVVAAALLTWGFILGAFVSVIYWITAVLILGLLGFPAFKYYKWFKEQSKENVEGLPLAHLFSLILCVLSLVQVILKIGTFGIGGVISGALQTLLCFYYYTVAKRYAIQKAS